MPRLSAFPFRARARLPFCYALIWWNVGAADPSSPNNPTALEACLVARLTRPIITLARLMLAIRLETLQHFAQSRNSGGGQ